jgi:NAD(P)-dependent dehydrogenase (short-subunit alcohol dehydrogenase family)
VQREAEPEARNPRALHLLADDDVEPEVVHAGAAVLLRNRHADEPVLARRAEDLARDDAVALPCGVVRDDLFGKEAAKAVAEGVVLVVKTDSASRVRGPHGATVRWAAPRTPARLLTPPKGCPPPARAPPIVAPMEIESAGALVLGGASGLGEATARALAASGARVVIADIDEARAVQVAEEIGGLAVRTDVTDEADVAAAVQLAATASGGLRVSVNCAGIGPPQRLLSKGEPAPMVSFERIVTVNLLGTIRVLRLAAAQMASQEPLQTGERGVCVNTASIAAYDGQIGQVAYSASKGGVVGLTLPAARDLAQRGVRVVTIAPGIFDTPLLATLPEETRESLAKAVPFPPRLGSPEEFAALVGHIVANGMLNGEVIRVDGALRLAPR